MPEDETIAKEGEARSSDDKKEEAPKPASPSETTPIPDAQKPASDDGKSELASEKPSKPDIESTVETVKADDTAEKPGPTAEKPAEQAPIKNEQPEVSAPSGAGTDEVKSSVDEAKKEAEAGDKPAVPEEPATPASPPVTDKKESETSTASSGEQKTEKTDEKTADVEPVKKDDAPIEKKVIMGDESKSVTQNERQRKLAQKPVKVEESAILVVEDNVVNFRLFARLLGYMGVFDYEWKTSGWQVAEFAATMNHIDLILLDIRLPYEDGFEVIKKLRQDQNLKDTLIVAVTAEASVQQMHRAQVEDFDGFIGKPIDPDRFPGQIKKILSGIPVWEIH